MGAVVQVSGAVGGVGATTVAWALALQRRGSAVVIDAQPDGAPLAVVVGAGEVPGACWSQVHVASADIDAVRILGALPQWYGVHLLSADEAFAYEPALQHVVAALRTVVDLVVVDAPMRTAIPETDLHLVLTTGDVNGLSAIVNRIGPAARLLTTNPERRFGVDDLGLYLPEMHLGHIRRQTAIARSMHDGLDLPPTSDVMRLAATVAGQLWP